MPINVVIPAAGLAMRLRPLSSDVSKAMVRVNGKPVIDYILDRLEALVDVAQVVIVDGVRGDIRDYVTERRPNVTFVRQTDLLGPRDAIMRGAVSLLDWTLPLVVWLGDAIILDDGLPLGKDFLLCKDVEDHARWCMWDGKNFFDKPITTIPDAVALVGLYSFSDGLRAIKSFANTRGYNISDALRTYGQFSRVMTTAWYDIGEVASYYKTCAELLNMKARSFNSFSYDPELNVLSKTATDEARDAIATESCWYDCLTDVQRLFTPRILHDPDAPHTLKMSYEPGILLSDLVLYDDVAPATWDYIIGRLVNIMRRHFHHPIAMSDDFRLMAEKMWVTKNRERILKTGFNDIDRFDLCEVIGRKIAMAANPIMYMHGDLHLGNVLYNVQNDHFVLLDPRGSYGGEVGSIGDDLYDWCKLAQDMYHGYNHLLVGRPRSHVLRDVFVKKMTEIGAPLRLIIEGGALLLASAIPMHADDPARQERFATAVSVWLDREWHA